ncbi:MAG: acyltransferase family protein [Pseudodonghicola sp.]
MTQNLSDNGAPAGARTGNRPKEARIAWLDSLRGLAILMVIAHHAILAMDALIPTGQIPGYFAHLNAVLYWMMLPTFFLSFGIFFSPQQGWSSVFRKRLTLYVWLIVVWTSLQFASELAGVHLYPWSGSPILSFRSLGGTPYGVLWFLYSLALCTLVLQALSSVRPIWQLTGVIGLYALIYLLLWGTGAQMHDLPFWVWQTIELGLPFALIGYWGKPALAWITDTTGRATLFCVLFYAVCVLLLVVGANDLDGLLKSLVCYIPATLGLVAFARLIPVRLSERLGLGWFGRHSLEIFLTHEFFIAIYSPRLFDPAIMQHLAAPLIWLAVVVLTAISSFGATVVLKRQFGGVLFASPWLPSRRKLMPRLSE